MQLPNRLKIIGDFIFDNSSVADVGADHGLLEEYVSSKLTNCHILAIENKAGPYKILVSKTSKLNNVETSLSDGLNKVKNNTDIVVLAGMGGNNIVSILAKNKDKVPTFKRIIIDAHRDIGLARKAIISYGYEIVKEQLVYEEEKFYIISVFDKTNKQIDYKDEQIEIGYELEKDKLWPKYKEHLINQAENAIKNLENSRNRQDKVLEFKRTIERIENYGKN